MSTTYMTAATITWAIMQKNTLLQVCEKGTIILYFVLIISYINIYRQFQCGKLIHNYGLTGKFNLNIELMQKQQPTNSKISQGQSIKIENKPEDETIFKNIMEYLSENKVQIQIMEHQPTRTSSESSLVRNTPLQWGCKTMLIQSKDDTIYMLVYRACHKVSWSKLRKIEFLGKKSRMCGQEIVKKLGVKPGGVPPFPKILGVKGIVDAKFFLIKQMAFNAGLQHRSILMKTQQFPQEDNLIIDITE